MHREKFASELDEEMAFHREQAERELAEDGVDPEAAHYAAMKQFGNATRLKEDSVETVGFGFESALRDLRYAARQLRHNPGFTATAMLVLAIGIGATTAIFSAVNPILFKPLPYPEASRVAMIWEMRDKGSQMEVTFGSFHGLSERQRSFEALAVMKPWQPSMAGDGAAGTVRGPAGERGILSRAGDSAGAGTRLRGGGRSVQGAQRRDPQRPAVATALRR